MIKCNLRDNKQGIYHHFFFYISRQSIFVSIQISVQDIVEQNERNEKVIRIFMN